MSEFERATPPERLALIHRARVAADVARRAQESAEPFVASIDAVLCDLYRQSLHWSLRALGNGEWSSIDPIFLRRAVPDPVLAARVERATSEATFETLATLPEDERKLLLGALRSTALILIAELEFDRRAVEAVWAQRLLRLGLVCVLLGVVGVLVSRAMDNAEQKRDLAQRVPWRTSSTNEGVPQCRSPEQECSESPEFFFHTQDEQSPWIEFDLGSVQSISGVRADNRKDCCVDRAAPIVVEVSSDQQHWRRVARRDTSFTSWLAKFSPVQARYVRLRLESHNPFHLQHVRVLR
jgi:hypothetical protein